MRQIEDLSTPPSEAELDELNGFLLSVEHDDAVLEVSEFDGFMTAIVSGPETIMPALWGGEDNAPVWDSLEDYQRIAGMMMCHMNTISLMLMQVPDELEPLFLERTVKGVTHWTVDEWCAGYMRGDKEIQALQEKIAPAACTIHAYWLARRTPAGTQPTPYVRAQPKIGRNDPCHCGSGKKYKKCCGAH